MQWEAWDGDRNIAGQKSERPSPGSSNIGVPMMSKPHRPQPGSGAWLEPGTGLGLGVGLELRDLIRSLIWTDSLTPPTLLPIVGAGQAGLQLGPVPPPWPSHWACPMHAGSARSALFSWCVIQQFPFPVCCPLLPRLSIYYLQINFAHPVVDAGQLVTSHVIN